MTEAVFDTDVLIDHLRGVKEAVALVSRVRDGKILGYISTITEAELFSGKDEEEEAKRTLLLNFLDMFERVEVNSAMARKAGEFRRKYGVEVPDAIIGATASLMGCKLFTRNIHDFEMIKEIEVEKPY
jgi:hypothetical protein